MPFRAFFCILSAIPCQILGNVLFMRSVGAKNGYSFVVVVVCWFAFVFFVTKFVVHSLSAVSKDILRVLLTMTSHHIGNWCMT